MRFILVHSITLSREGLHRVTVVEKEIKVNIDHIAAYHVAEIDGHGGRPRIPVTNLYVTGCTNPWHVKETVEDIENLIVGIGG